MRGGGLILIPRYATRALRTELSVVRVACPPFLPEIGIITVLYNHPPAPQTRKDLVCVLSLEKKKKHAISILLKYLSSGFDMIRELSR